MAQTLKTSYVQRMGKFIPLYLPLSCLKQINVWILARGVIVQDNSILPFDLSLLRDLGNDPRWGIKNV